MRLPVAATSRQECAHTRSHALRRTAAGGDRCLALVVVAECLAPGEYTQALAVLRDGPALAPRRRLKYLPHGPCVVYALC